MKAGWMKVVTLLGIGAVLFGAVAATPAMADGARNSHHAKHYVHHKHYRHGHRRVMRRK